jgi:hypothetical protein
MFNIFLFAFTELRESSRECYRHNAFKQHDVAPIKLQARPDRAACVPSVLPSLLRVARDRSACSSRRTAAKLCVHSRRAVCPLRAGFQHAVTVDPELSRRAGLLSR